MNDPSKTRIQRTDDLRRFYNLLDQLGRNIDGPRLLSTCDGHLAWPKRGVYFFFEPGEHRTISGCAPRVTRVGTHGLKTGSSSTLWTRLSQHRGTSSGSGNHRGSIFRLLVGAALADFDPTLRVSTWAQGNTAKGHVRDIERDLEQRVSSRVLINAT